ncbi:helix-turn-helix domain-containing protein [Halostella sp. PRR32]|uniref:helix-turn-helix transcriptional regulator n=1 Tax=Halostella sp. PRR32 TaxID=3098147 RepID=UPI002B1D08D2|nr:helix-turn-helix domain-containing protein [Halostella sp. PRR32]
MELEIGLSNGGVTPVDVTSVQVDAEVADLTPSCKLVYLVLEEADECLTQATIREHTQLPDRTVYRALTKLEDAGIVESEPSLSDARQRLYQINYSP